MGKSIPSMGKSIPSMGKSLFKSLSYQRIFTRFKKVNIFEYIQRARPVLADGALE